MRHESSNRTQEGCLVIADITGYTAFLSHSELDHAQDSLRTLLEVILERSRPSLVLSKLEGDAVFTYAPVGAFIQGESLVDAIEGIYVAFARALERMILNTNCTCNACRNIPNLDLKFFVHYGAFAVQTIEHRPELIGNDVILLHRLTKNAITERTGLRAYAAYTQAAVGALGLAEFAASLTPHREAYEHLGEVPLYVQDMRAVWERERLRTSYAIPESDAKFRYEADFPVPAALLWGYLTAPHYRNILMGSKSQTLTGLQAGRTGLGSVYQCAHGKGMVSRQTVLEWRPFDEFTFDGTMPYLKGVLYRFTGRLTPTTQGTHCTVLCAPSRGSPLGKFLAGIMMRLPPTIADGLQHLRSAVDKDMEERGQVIVESTVPTSDEVAAEARTTLAAP